MVTPFSAIGVYARDASVSNLGTGAQPTAGPTPDPLNRTLIFDQVKGQQHVERGHRDPAIREVPSGLAADCADHCVYRGVA
jgi:hypothetical protein